jgi:hypothetical protein
LEVDDLTAPPLAHGIARKHPVPRLSILIPALGDGDFEDTLASVLQHRPDDSEVIVAHARPYDDPYRLSGEVCFVARPKARQKVDLLNAGFEAARSSIVHVVQCGLTVGEGWTESAVEHFADEQIASVAPVIIDADSPRRIVAAGQAYSSWGRVSACCAGRKLDRKLPSSDIIGPTLAAGFYRRSWWRLIRWDESLGDDFADAHFNLTIAELGGQTALASDCILRSADHTGLTADEPYGFATARQAERLFWSHLRHDPTLATLSSRAVLMLGEALLALPGPRAATGLLGRLMGLLSKTRAQAFREHVDELAARLAGEAEAGALATLSLAEERQKRIRFVPNKKQAA